MNDQPAALPRFLTVKQVADALTVSQRLVYKLLAAGQLQGVRVASAIRVPEPAVWDYLGRATQATAAPVPPAPPATRPAASRQPLAFHFFPRRAS